MMTVAEMIMEVNSPLTGKTLELKTELKHVPLRCCVFTVDVQHLQKKHPTIQRLTALYRVKQFGHLVKKKIQSENKKN